MIRILDLVTISHKIVLYLLPTPFSLRNCLSSTAKEIRAGVLRVLRYILKTGNEFDIMMKLHIDLLVARSVDAPVLRDIERLQAFRFIRQVRHKLSWCCLQKKMFKIVSIIIIINQILF